MTDFRLETASSNGVLDDLVSVLIPVYNHEAYIRQSLNSVLADSHPQKEIVIIDDGSRDSSRKVVEGWIRSDGRKFPGRIAFESRDNLGITKTLNELVAASRGTYVAILASDDYLLPNGISRRVNYLKNNPGKYAVFADCIVVDGTGIELHSSGIEELWGGRKRCLRHDALMPYELIFRWCVPGPVFLARREVYDIVGGYDEELVIEDWDFYLRLISRGYLGFLDCAVAAYRMHSANSHTNLKSETRRKLLSAMIRGGENNIYGFHGLKRLRIHLKNLSYRITIKEIDENIKENSILRRFTGKATRVLEGAYERKVNRILGTVP